MTVLPCPFCGMTPDMSDPDTLYPTGTMWAPDDDRGRRYFHRSEAPAGAHACYVMNCVETAGGCGAEIHGDTRAETLAKWNRRPATPSGPPSGYESTTPWFTRYVSPERYSKFAPTVQSWYRPYWVGRAQPNTKERA